MPRRTHLKSYKITYKTRVKKPKSGKEVALELAAREHMEERHEPLELDGHEPHAEMKL